jgi:hypothetical protein
METAHTVRVCVTIAVYGRVPARKHTARGLKDSQSQPINQLDLQIDETVSALTMCTEKVHKIYISCALTYRALSHPHPYLFLQAGGLLNSP